MASNTAVTSERRRIRNKNAGKKRKKAESKRSTPSAAALFSKLDGKA